MRGQGAAVGEDLTGVIEEDHSVAQQAPALLGVDGYSVGGVMIDRFGRWALRLVRAHDRHLNSSNSVVQVSGGSGIYLFIYGFILPPKMNPRIRV